jgi:hypothetical protein
MSHWFDRLATWSAEDRDDGEQRLLTRRQVVGSAATGAGAVGLLGSPLVSEAWGIFGGSSRACKCWDAAGHVFDKQAGGLVDAFIFNAAVVTPIFQAEFLAGYLAAGSQYLGSITNCGFCRDDPPNKPPPPKAQPCVQRGGIRRGDQCAPPPNQGVLTCPEHTTACQDDSCCFEGDACCPCPESGGYICCAGSIGCTCC